MAKFALGHYTIQAGEATAGPRPFTNACDATTPACARTRFMFEDRGTGLTVGTRRLRVPAPCLGLLHQHHFAGLHHPLSFKLIQIDARC